jgi:hypothetical protein
VGAEAALSRWRERLYGCLQSRADALFDLTDAILAAGVVPSTVHLSLADVHRRRWGSLYAALSKGRIDGEALRGLLAVQTLGKGEAAVFAVDVSPWPRCDAECSPERGYYYRPCRHSAGQPIVAGWAYQFVARLSFERDSWAAPVDARRVRPEQDANDVAADQVRGLVGRLPARDIAPLFVFDAGYDPVRLRRNLAGCRAQILVRLHSGRTFYAEPEIPQERPVDRPFRHGKKFACKDPKTWPRPTAERHACSADYGAVRVRA